VPEDQNDDRFSGEAAILLRTNAGRALVVAVLVLLVATIAGLVALWPPQPSPAVPSQAFGGKTLPATVQSASLVPCPGPVAQDCRRIIVTVEAGPDEGKTKAMTLGPSTSSPDIAPGSHIRVVHIEPPPGAAVTVGFQAYQFVDYDRHMPLIWLGAIFAVLAIFLARWRGLLALLGVGLSLLLVTKFLVPALLAGSSPLLVSLVGALAVMFLTLVMTSGFGLQTMAAALGIGATLLLTTLLGELFVHLAHLNGYTSELSSVLPQAGIHISLQGVVLAGMIVGALGVLADMAVSQASAVMAIRRANPALGPAQLYRGAFAVGRDHLSATVHTLVLAYVGASLPLLLIIQGTGVGVGDAFNFQDISEPIVATLVGSIGLIAAVPLTTGLTAQLASHLPADALPEHAHQH
jgi:uncharacterized membrane protein